jgi:hypothetical protein
MVPNSFDKNIIQQMVGLGHEIGYHYEDMDFAKKEVGGKPKEADLYEKAFAIFTKNLDILKELYPVRTICMHGSPLSKFDNKALWKKYDYKKLGIIGEPYYDINFDEVFYITDTGRRWDGDKVSVRDKVKKNSFSNLSFHSTEDLIEVIKKGDYPEKVMMTFHPQRWTDSPSAWVKEFVLQNAKNIIKGILIKRKK